MSRSAILALLVAFAMFALSAAFTAPAIALRSSAASSRCVAQKMAAADDEKARREAVAAAKPRAPAQNDYLSQFAKGPSKASQGSNDKNTRIVRFP